MVKFWMSCDWVVEHLLALVAHGGEFIDRNDALVADDAGGGERSGVSVEAHFLGRDAHDPDEGFIDLVLEHDLVIDSGLGVRLAVDEGGGRVLALQHRDLGGGQIDEGLVALFLIVVGPPFDEAGADGEGVLEGAVQDQKARVVLPEDVVDVIRLLCGGVDVGFGSRHEVDDVFALAAGTGG